MTYLGQSEEYRHDERTQWPRISAQSIWPLWGRGTE